MHCIPTWDTGVHDLGLCGCPCGAERDDEAPMMIRHFAFDQREAYETGLRKRH